MSNIRRMMMATAGTAGGTPNAFGWGDNDNGPLGQGPTPRYSSPVQVGSVAWDAVATGEQASWGISGGKLYSWGNAAYGKLGHGNTTELSEPTQVGSLSTWSKIITSNRTAWFIKTDGTLWGRGENNFGELGFGETTVRSSPVQIGSETDWLGTAHAGLSDDHFIFLRDL